jgi:cytochrome c peroxidase
MPQSTQEELGKELFDDPLLSIDNVKKLADCMQWSFKYTKVSLLLLLIFLE